MKSFAASTVIAASPESIWQILIDAPSYPSWNSTVTRVEGAIAPGETVTVHVKATLQAFPVKVVGFDAPSRMVWRSGMPLGLFTGERVFALRRSGAGTEFSMKEEYTGLMAPLIGRSIPDLQPAFDEFAACLKKRAEAG